MEDPASSPLHTYRDEGMSTPLPRRENHGGILSFSLHPLAHSCQGEEVCFPWGLGEELSMLRAPCTLAAPSVEQSVHRHCWVLPAIVFSCVQERRLFNSEVKF